MILHATTVARGRRAVLIRGASGTGKSSLALQMLALGGRLVADDLTEVAKGKDGRLWARSPADGPGLVEARGLGLLSAPRCDAAPIALIVDLDRVEDRRLPHLRSETLAAVQLPLCNNTGTPVLASALWHYLWYGRDDPEAPLNSETRDEHAAR